MNEDRRLANERRRAWRTFLLYKAPLPIYFGLLVIAALVGVYFAFVWLSRPEPVAVRFPDGFVVRATVADTETKRRYGLSDQPYLAPDHGMLFLFDAPVQPSFWMKDMNFPIDIIWLSGTTVVEITQNAPVPIPGVGTDELPRYGPDSPVDRVLEVNAGFAAAHGIMQGETVRYE